MKASDCRSDTLSGKQHKFESCLSHKGKEDDYMNFADDLVITGLVGVLLTAETKPTTKIIISSALVIIGVILHYGFGLA